MKIQPKIRPLCDASYAAMDQILAALKAAFDSDPLMAWIVGNEDVEQRRRMYTAACMTVSVNSLSRFSYPLWGAALWTDPALMTGFTVRLLGMLLSDALGADHLAHLVPGLQKLKELRPSEAYYHLTLVGVDPEAQRNGVGTALVRETLDLCDEQKVSAYCEVSNEALVPWYRNLGFELQGACSLEEFGGPRIWTMQRPPLSAKENGKSEEHARRSEQHSQQSHN